MLLGIIGILILAGAGGFLLFPEKNTSSFKKVEDVIEDVTSPIEPVPLPIESIQPPKSTPLPTPSVVPTPALKPTPAPQLTLPPPSPTPVFPIALPPIRATQSCSGKGTVVFTSPLMRIEEIGFIMPLGGMIGGHVTPIDHGYYYSLNWKPTEIHDSTKFKDIFAPADGIVSGIGHMPGAKEGEDYRLEIRHTCTFYTIYIHVQKLSTKLSQALGGSSGKAVNVPVKAGEVIGRSNGFDFSVHDEEITLPGFIVPVHYDEPWKIHTVDMFNYFVEPVKSLLLSKNVRQKEPRSGKIDYDIDGRLVGNWFLEGTGGYRGGSHLAFAYDSLDPSLVVASMWNFNKEPRQFAVKGNMPDPATVSVTSGLTKYELVDTEYMTEEGTWWDRISFAKIFKVVAFNEIAGVVLVEMLESRRIRFEVFPGKTASEVTGFTSEAKIYER